MHLELLQEIKELGHVSLKVYGVLSSVIGGDPVFLNRRDSDYIWLTGAGESYLAGLPRLPANQSP